MRNMHKQKKFSKGSGLYFITDSSLSGNGIIPDVKAALGAGVKVVQYREKNLDSGIQFREALEIRNLCRKHGAIFIVNDRVDIALAVGADGVHLGQSDIPLTAVKKIFHKGIIGVTVHSVAEAKAAEKCGASYLGVSPIFATATKKDAGEPAGIKLLCAVRKAVDLPLVAIGGINESNLDSVLSTGCRDVAVISAILKSPDVGEKCREFNQRILNF